MRLKKRSELFQILGGLLGICVVIVLLEFGMFPSLEALTAPVFPIITMGIVYAICCWCFDRWDAGKKDD